MEGFEKKERKEKFTWKRIELNPPPSTDLRPPWLGMKVSVCLLSSQTAAGSSDVCVRACVCVQVRPGISLWECETRVLPPPLHPNPGAFVSNNLRKCADTRTMVR